MQQASQHYYPGDGKQRPDLHLELLAAASDVAHNGVDFEVELLNYSVRVPTAV